jgi:hypothetical protein
MKTRVLCIAIAASLLAACGGGGGSSTVPANPGNSGSPSGGGKGQTAQAQLTITVPGSGSGTQGVGTQSVRPNYVSQNAQSLTITMDSQTFTYGITATSDGCTQPGGTGTEVTCTENLSAPVGTYSWTFDIYSGTGGTGSVLALDTHSETITEGILNDVSVTLNGVVGSYSLGWLSTPSFIVDDSSDQTGTLLLNVLDPSGATIITSGDYVTSSGTAVTFTLGDNQPTGTVYSTYGYTLSTGSETGPDIAHVHRMVPLQHSNSITVGYEGVEEPAVTFTATDSADIQPSGASLEEGALNGAFTASVTCNEPTNNDACSNGTTGSAGSASFLGGGDTASVALAEPGWTDAPYSQSVSTASNTCTGGTYGVTLSGSSNAYTLTANTGDNPGSCAVTFQDNSANAQQVTVDGYYTYETVIIERVHEHE